MNYVDSGSPSRRRRLGVRGSEGRLRVRGWIGLAAALGILAGSLLSMPLHAQDKSSSDEGALFLLLPVGAHGVGMGRAMTGVCSAEGAFWNPAGLGCESESRIILFRGDHLAGPATGFSLMLGRQDLGALGVSYNLLDVGTQDLTDGVGNVLGSITVRGHQGVVSAGGPIAPTVLLGANLRFVQFSQSCRGQCPDGGVTASTFAGDLGVQWIPFSQLPFRVGIMLAHLGPALQVENVEQRDPLPSRIRLAAGYDGSVGSMMGEDIGLSVFVELEDRLRGAGSPAGYLGAELRAGAGDQLYLRGGYILGNRSQTDGAALGLGVRYERFELGIARSLARGGPAPDQEPVHLTLALRL